MKFKSKKRKIVQGLFLFGTAVLFESVFVEILLPEGRNGIIALVLSTIFFSGFLALGGIFCFIEYYKSAKGLKKALKKYGKDTIIDEVERNTLIEYKEPILGEKVYFTNRFIVDRRTIVIDYHEISMVYKDIIKQGDARISCITFALLNGNKYYLCKFVDEEKIMQMFQLCYDRNPQLLIGNNKENQKLHKENVKAYKKGCKDSCDLTATRPSESTGMKHETDSPAIGRYGKTLQMPKEWTPEGKEHEKGKYMMFLGGMFVIFCTVMLLLLPIMIHHNVDTEVNAISEAEKEKMLEQGYQEYRTQGWYLECIYSYVSGKKPWDSKDLYLFQLEGEENLYLGVISKDRWESYDTRACSGQDIFYAGDTVTETIKRKDKVYQVQVIDIEKIVSIYGIESKESIMEKELSIWMAMATCIPLILVGVVLFFVGKNKKNRNIV